MAATNAEYSTAITNCREVLRTGGSLTGADYKLIIRVIQDGIARLSAIDTLINTHMAILQAVGAGDASAQIDTADAALVVSIPTYVTSTVADG